MKKKKEDIFRRKLTERGFVLFNFKDSNGEECSLQESSAFREDTNFIWLGRDKVGRMHLSQSQARQVAEEFLYFAKHGKLKTDWQKFNINMSNK